MKNKLQTIIFSIAFGAALTGCGGSDEPISPATPKFTQIDQRSNLTPTDSIDWGVVNENTYDGNAPTEFKTIKGNWVQFDGSTEPDNWGYQSFHIWTVESYAYAVGTHFDFLPNENFARTYWGTLSHISLTFTTPIRGMGAQFQPRAGKNFVVKGHAYDSTGNLIGSVSGSYTVKGQLDGSAPFLGFRSDQSNIKRVVFTVEDDSDLSDDFGNEVWMNRVDIES